MPPHNPPYDLLAPLQAEAGVIPGQLLHGGGQALHGALHLVIIISMVMMIVLQGFWVKSVLQIKRWKTRRECFVELLLLMKHGLRICVFNRPGVAGAVL